MNHWLFGHKATKQALTFLPENLIVTQLVEAVGRQAGSDRGSEHDGEEHASDEVFCFWRSAHTDFLGKLGVIGATAPWITGPVGESFANFEAPRSIGCVMGPDHSFCSGDVITPDEGSLCVDGPELGEKDCHEQQHHLAGDAEER